MVHLREELNLPGDSVLHSGVVCQVDLLDGIHPPVQQVANLYRLTDTVYGHFIIAGGYSVHDRHTEIRHSVVSVGR